MSGFVPSGYITTAQAIDRVGREMFASAWTSDEYKARPGLINQEKWRSLVTEWEARTGNSFIEAGRPYIGPSGSGAGGASYYSVQPKQNGDPDSPEYQLERESHERYAAAFHELWRRLEAGVLGFVVLNPWTGDLEKQDRKIWRRAGAYQMLSRGEASLRYSSNTGTILVQEFTPRFSVVGAPFPQAKVQEAIERLRQEMLTKTLTRDEQKDFVRRHYPTFHITEPQFRAIFREVKVLPGRRRKADAKP